MTIGKLTRATAAACKDIEKLLPSLRLHSKEHSAPLSDLRHVVRDKNITLIVAKDGKQIIGMGFLYVQIRLGKRMGYIEDVVVDEAYRGQGLGEKIMRELIKSAKKGKLGSVALTSRPERESANRLYQRLGFDLAKTNAYRMKL